ncbi:hypothetical protein OROGR_010277 [Orobanche gracilis]
MTMRTERSKPLHNFTLPLDLRWGNQRFLRCMKVNSGGQISPLHRVTNSSGSSDHHHHDHLQIQQRRTTMDRERERNKDSSSLFANGSPNKSDHSPTRPSVTGGVGRRFGDDDDGIAATREKVLLDLQTAADKMKNAFFKDGGLEEGEVSISRSLLPQTSPPPAAASAEGEIHRPWNLRTRRAACRTPASGFATAASLGNNGGSVKGLRVDAPRPNPGSSQPQMRAPPSSVTVQNSPIHRSEGGGTAAIGENKERQRAKFSVSLSKREIEEDFFSIAGHRPPRRPKKRARIIQKQLDTLFPGLWLTEVTPDMYKVPDAAP